MQSVMLRRILVGFLLLTPVCSIPIDNGIEGDPEVECGPTALEINVNTKNPFVGHVYVKGLYSKTECRHEGTGEPVGGIQLPFDSCNVARMRSLSPRGVFVRTTIVITFHPQFLTKIDRAYRIECFYMEAGKTVSAQLEVSDLTTVFQTQALPMPICRYDILEGGPTGQPVQFGIIGQEVYHKWTCDSETTDTFCAVVHSCIVDDGNGNTIEILNDGGCALDKHLLNNLEYPTDLMAGQEAHIYKYADRSQLFYQCQITITIKEPGSECPKPTCSEPEGFGALKSGQIEEIKFDRARLIRKRAIDDENTLDVRTEINTLEIIDQDIALPTHLQHLLQTNARQHIVNSQSLDGACMSPLAILLFLVTGVTIVATVLAATLLHVSTHKP